MNPCQAGGDSVLARLVRVYGTEDRFGEEPRMDPIGGPIAVGDFPKAGDQSSVWLGAVPSQIAEVERMRVAIGTALLRRMVNAGEGRPLTERSVDERMEDVLRHRPELAFEDHSWYLTLVVERGIDLPRGALREDEEIMWLDHGLGVDVAGHMRRELGDAVEILAGVLAVRLGRGVLQDRIVDDHIHFAPVGDGPGSTLSLPEFSGTARVSVQKPVASLHVEDLRDQLVRLGSSRGSGLGWLRRAAFWYASSLETADPWQRFEWAFFSLEMLTNKLQPQLQKGVVESLVFRSVSQSAVEVAGEPIKRMLWDPDRSPPLVAKFTTVALALSPDTAEQDVGDFVVAAKSRGRLAHGQITDAAELPESQTFGLADRYLKLALERLT